MLSNKPDFRNVDSILEADAKAWGFQILFLPKFHCELNFIKQCWGHAKRQYRIFPPSSKEDDLEQNVLQALDEVPLISMRRWVICKVYFWVIATHQISNLKMVVAFQVCDTITPIHECLSDGLEWNTGCLGCKEISRALDNSCWHLDPIWPGTKNLIYILIQQCLLYFT